VVAFLGHFWVPHTHPTAYTENKKEKDVKSLESWQL